MTEVNPIEPDPTQSLDTRLVEILERYMADRREGRAPDRDEVLAQYPDLADELKSCLEGIDLLGDEPALQPLVRRGSIGDFQLGKEIGRGGMGVVYQAHQKSLDRTVALKILSLPITDPKVMERFQREAALAAGLQHAGIVPIYEVGSEAGTHFYAMQLIPGRSLAEVSRDPSAPLDLEQVARWGLQAAEALAHAHERGVIHRDIKPSNLILDAEQHVWLTDFGLARRMDDVRLSVTGAVLGTPRYMSPEQASTISAPVDERTDIYSLGATLYELACGKPAVPGDHPVAVIKSIMNDHRRSPRQYRPEISRDLETILLRCLEKHPSDRYPNVTSLAGDLRALIEHRPIASRPATWMENSRRWLSHNRRVMRWAGFGGMAVALLLCVSLWARFVYPTLDDAQLEMSTKGAGLRADLIRLDGASEPVSVSVPTTQPIVLDAGQWMARLAQPGAFSHDVRHWLEPGDDRGILLPTPPRPLWEIDGVLASHPVRTEAGEELLIITADSIELRKGRTGERLWTRPSDELQLTYGKGGVLDSSWGIYPDSPDACYPVKPICVVGEVDSGIVDVDGDGTPDLLLGSFTHPAILALSGADGSTIWVQNYSEPFGKHETVAGMRCLRIDAGREGEIYASFATDRLTSGCRIARIDAADGSLDWKVKRDYTPTNRRDGATAMIVPSRSPSDAGRWNRFHHQGYTFVQQVERHSDWSHDVTVAPLISGNDNALHCATETDLMSIDRDDGRVTDRPGFFPGAPVMPVQLLRGKDPAKTTYLVAAQVKSLQHLTEKERLSLICYDETFDKVIWHRNVRADSAASAARWTGRPRLPLVVDLNHDGEDEIVIQSDRTDLPSGRFAQKPVWTDLQILDSDGVDLLPTAVRTPNADLQLSHVQVVDDKDGDEWDDLVLATRYLATRDDRGAIHVELIGSRSGEVIWHRRLESRDTVKVRGPPEIHQLQRHVLAGKERLIVGIVGDTGFGIQHETFLLDAVDGAVDGVGMKLSVRSVLDASGVEPVLWCVDWSKENRDRLSRGRSYRAMRLPGEEVLHVSQDAEVVADIDGDGRDDLQVRPVSRGGGGSNRIVSARTGDLIPMPLSERNGQAHVRSVGCDFTGNGKNDFLAWQPDATPRLYEGGTRREFWTLSENLFMTMAPLAVIPASLETKDSQDLILVTYGELAPTPTFGLASWKMPMLVLGIRGRDGELLWKQDFGLVATTGGFEQLNHASGDLNGDGRIDIVFSYFDVDTASMFAVNTASMFAVSGATGKKLWTISDVYTDRPNWLARFPEPVIFRVGQRRRVAFLGPKPGSPTTHNYRLVIADGASGRVLSSEDFISRHANSTRLAREKKWGRHQVVALRHASPGDAVFAFWLMNDQNRVEIHTRKAAGGSFVEAHPPWTVGDDPHQSEAKRWMRLLAADVDKDGADELILAEPGFVSAFRQDGTRIWRYAIGEEPGMLETIRKVGDKVECVFSLPGKNQSLKFVALDIQDGSPRWTMNGGGYMKPIGGDAVRGMIDSAALPTFALADSGDHTWVTVTATPSPGVTFRPTVPPIKRVTAAIGSEQVDTRWLGSGPYPGPVDVLGVPRWRFAGRMVWSVLWSIFVVLLPLFLIVRVATRRQFSLSMMLAITAALSACFAVLTVPVAHQTVTIGDRIQMGLGVAPFFVWVILIFAFYRRGPKFAWLTLLVAPLVLLVSYEFLNIAFSMPRRVVIPADVLRLWRGLMFTIPITAILGSPIWAALWFHRSRQLSRSNVHVIS